MKPFTLALLSAALFGAATPASKVLLADLSAFQLAGLLYLGAALGVAPLAWGKGRFRIPGRQDSRNRFRLLGAVVAGGIAGPVLLLLGLRFAEAASVSLWLTFELVATALLGALVFREPLGRGWAQHARRWLSRVRRYSRSCGWESASPSSMRSRQRCSPWRSPCSCSNGTRTGIPTRQCRTSMCTAMTMGTTYTRIRGSRREHYTAMLTRTSRWCTRILIGRISTTGIVTTEASGWLRPGDGA